MRVHGLALKDDEAQPLFIRDIPGGQEEVECDSCGTPQVIEQSGDNCINCKKFFVYRPWWEW